MYTSSLLNNLYNYTFVIWNPHQTVEQADVELSGKSSTGKVNMKVYILLMNKSLPDLLPTYCLMQTVITMHLLRTI